MSAKKKERRDAELLRIGGQMSNVCFNLGQRGEGNKGLYELCQQWDAEKRKYLSSFKRKRKKP